MKVVVSGVFAFFLLLFLSFTKIDHFSSDILLESHIDGTELPFIFQGIDEILSKPLRYIGNGLEAVAFVSADEQYVLKFFLKKQILKKSFFKPKKRFKQLLNNNTEIKTGLETLKKYEVALQHLTDETGLLAVYRGGAIENLPVCTVVDYRGREHKIDLNQVAFVVQKKAKIINRYMYADEFEKVNRELQDFFARLASKGFVNLSHVFNPENFAILDNRAVMIDLGKLEFAPENSYELEEAKLSSRYSAWLAKKLVIIH